MWRSVGLRQRFSDSSTDVVFLKEFVLLSCDKTSYDCQFSRSNCDNFDRYCVARYVNSDSVLTTFEGFFQQSWQLRSTFSKIFEFFKTFPSFWATVLIKYRLGSWLKWRIENWETAEGQSIVWNFWIQNDRTCLNENIVGQVGQNSITSVSLGLF